MRSQPAKLRANSTSLGSAWISTESKNSSKISTDLRDPLRRGRTAHHVAHRGDDQRPRAHRLRRLEERQQLEAQPRAAEGELLGDQDVGRLGAQQVEQALGRARRGRPRRAACRRGGTARAASRRPRAAAAVDGSARRPGPGPGRARRPTPAARRSRRPPGRAPGWRRGADGRCPADAAHGRRRARSRRTIEGHVEAIDGDAAVGARRKEMNGSASRACAAAGRSCPSRSPAPAGRGSRPCARRRRRAGPAAAIRAVQRPRRAMADARRFPARRLEVEPPALGGEEGLADLARSSAMVWPSQMPKLISRRAESTVTAAEGCSSSAVRRARCSGLDIRGQPSAGGGRRQLRASASPAALSVVSVRPCRRRSSFQAVDAWRRMAKGTPLIAGSASAAARAWAAARSSWCAAIRALAAAASRARSAGASSSRATPTAKAAHRPIGVSKPVTPSATTAGTPPVRPATTGRPAAWASRKAMPIGFVDRGPKVKVGAGIKRRQRLVRHRAGKAHARDRAAPSGPRPRPAPARRPPAAPATGWSFSRARASASTR